MLRNARLYDRMGCDLLALDLVRRWEFLGGLPVQISHAQPPIDFQDGAVDYRKMLRRRSSLVVADLPVRPVDALHARKQPAEAEEKKQQQQVQISKPPPTMFHEPDSNSLLDSFGF